MSNFNSDNQKRILIILGEHLEWNIEKMISWLNSDHDMIGGKSPMELLREGRSEKLSKIMNDLVRK